MLPLAFKKAKGKEKNSITVYISPPIRYTKPILYISDCLKVFHYHTAAHLIFQASSYMEMNIHSKELSKQIQNQTQKYKNIQCCNPFLIDIIH
jgi:hypothetical protein